MPVIAQERASGDVLMVAWMNREALAETAARGQAVYWSRSRGRLWHKGEDSGHVQQVHEIRLDCDDDVVLLKVTQLGHEPGIACHTGRHSCFFQRYAGRRLAHRRAGAEGPGADLQMTRRRTPTRRRRHPGPPGRRDRSRAAAATPTSSYVARLFDKGADAMLKKVGEEATEVVMAAKDGGRAQASSPRWPTCGSTA